jgi:hypothetical protein
MADFMQRQELEKMHPELYSVIHRIFREFWELDLDQKLMIPFFSFITREKCADLGIPDYFSKIVAPMTLPIIKVILFSISYCIISTLLDSF